MNSSAAPVLCRRRFLLAAGGVLMLHPIAGCASRRHAAGERKAGSSNARDLGHRVAEHVAGQQLGNVEYPTVCCAYGVLRFGRASGESALVRRVEAIYADYLSGGSTPDRYQNGRTLEHRWFGIIPLELGFRRDPRYAAVARREADLTEAEPAKHADLYYVDHMYGVGTLQAKAYARLHESKYAERCLSHLLVHCGVLQRPDGLFDHSERGRQAWGRGNGWAAAAMTEALLVLPRGYARRDELLSIWRGLMAALVRHQDAEGRWHQIVDLPASWPETSCTAMFVFALATGLKAGWLRGSVYREAATRGWRALSRSVDDQGRLADVCIGLGDDPGTQAHYLACPRRLGDKHGQAPLLWAASAMLELG